ncbi:XRE family transcriptional regulator [Roseivivax halodurans JCM 10272]|uniref:XRE family transcriptional regulator n=1 Tax=Roseivivax halodurans JCM 10272 TaxID=1449350 RepID=X7EFN9_9RHOB|nr:helix-turn-helix domain-containing protein [Roseivivax halodurans]ETX14874.1 XRE family transcriptional regulator [Roseivivax halodurans JCM 10272]
MDDETDWYGPDAATFGDRLAAAREAAGMTSEELAKRLGVKHATMQAWEADRSEPRANRLQMLSGILNVSIMWLLNGEGDGLSAPSDEGIETADVRAILTDLREVRTEMKASAERVGRLEKRLRQILREAQS